MPKRFTLSCASPISLALLLAGAAVTAQPAPVPPPIAQPHADCARPQYASDMLVCGDAELTAIDTEVTALASTPPLLADGAIWEDQTAWFRRRSMCAFNADHRDCLIAAYTDRRSVLTAAAAPATARFSCSGEWQGRILTARVLAPGGPVTIRENGLLMGVATQKSADWQPILASRAAHSGFKLKAQDGRQFNCRPALP